MRGMVVDSWPYVIAAYAITWTVLIAYSIRLIRMTRRQAMERSQLRETR